MHLTSFSNARSSAQPERIAWEVLRMIFLLTGFHLFPKVRQRLKYVEKGRSVKQEWRPLLVLGHVCRGTTVLQVKNFRSSRLWEPFLVNLETWLQPCAFLGRMPL